MANLDPKSIRQLKDAGLTLIPLNAPETRKKGKPLGKAPLDRNWTKKDYSDFDAEAHMENDYNVGVRLDRLLVVDDDPRHHDSIGYSDSNEEIIDDPITRLGLDSMLPKSAPRVITGGGGTHTYLRLPEGVTSSELSKCIADYPGMDFLSGSRHQVVAPGSVHPDGGVYEIDSLEGDFANIPTAPSCLIDALRKKKPSASQVSEAGSVSPEILAQVLKGLDAEDFRDHGSWLNLMMSCHHATGGSGREEFIEWSMSDPVYSGTDENVRSRWDSLDAEKKDGITVGTLIRALRKVERKDLAQLILRGDPVEDFAVVSAEEIPGRALSLDRSGNSGGQLTEIYTGPAIKDNFGTALKVVQMSNIDPAFDELKQAIVFKGELPWLDGYGRELDEHTGRMLRHFFVNEYNSSNYQPSKDNIWEATITLAYEAKFNPVLDYIDGLEWDREKRVEKLFAKYFKTEDDEYSAAVSTCFMVAAVRRQRHPGCKFDTMPVLKGKQGVGKSTGLKILFSEEFFSDADMGDLKNKDAALLLQGIWLQEFAELDGIRRAEANTLKGFCSRSVDRIRKPYAKGVEDLKRRCIFAGTVNESGYLVDSTGNRRFWPLTVEEHVDLKALERDRDQLWAEAAELESDGVAITLDRGLWDMASAKQSDEGTQDPWADIIRLFLDQRSTDCFDYALGQGDFDKDGYRLNEVPPSADRIHTQELLDVIGLKGSMKSKAASQRLRSVMENELGWIYKHSIRIDVRVLAGYQKPDT